MLFYSPLARDLWHKHLAWFTCLKPSVNVPQLREFLLINHGQVCPKGQKLLGYHNWWLSLTCVYKHSFKDAILWRSRSHLEDETQQGCIMKDPLYTSDGGQCNCHGIQHSHGILKHSIVPVVSTCRQHYPRQIGQHLIQCGDRFFTHVDSLCNVEQRGPVGLIFFKLGARYEHLLNLDQ